MNYTFMSEYSLYEILEDSVNYEITEYLGGYHIKVEYPNGYGASIAKHDSSYGRSEDLWELAVLHNGEIAYNTSITSDVVGYLDDDEVVSFCHTIRDWDKNGNPTNGWSFEDEWFYYECYETHYQQEQDEEMNRKAEEEANEDYRKWCEEHWEELDEYEKMMYEIEFCEKTIEDEDEWYDDEQSDAE